ncbi:MAG: anaerobic ribonucleoside-triphosphate reductase activating protein [Clostridia bacterium]|nr:anaerobic ribonucleoside-triphosphate reductase activating protein [Clostridia bacterium]
MKVAGFYDESISNGAGGHRAVLFVSGCPHHCPGCHNREAQDFCFGTDFESSEQKYLDSIKENSILKGITISGGEPLCKENIEEVYKFIKDVKKIRPELDVWCYTGYTIEKLKERDDEITNKTLKEINTLVDGPFIQDKKNPTLRFRGSENQRILDVQKCIKDNIIAEKNIV